MKVRDVGDVWGLVEEDGAGLSQVKDEGLVRK